jgi:putative glycosyltransferase (TIGR04372 family)
MKNKIPPLLKKIFIVTPHLYTIGNSSEEIYLSLIKARKESKKVLFLTPFNIFYLYTRSIQCNTLIKINTQYSISQNNILIILIRILFSFFTLFCRFVDIFLAKFFNKTDTFFRDYAICPRIGISSIYNPYSGSLNEIERLTVKYGWDDAFSKPLNLSNNFSIKHTNNKKIINELGLNSKKYVCLHVRSSETYDDSIESHERNANIENYYSVIKYLIEKKYHVVRMGDSNMPRANKIKGLLDYAHSENNNQYNDQCLIANCSFYIGMTSGIHPMAWLFEKDMIIVNNPAWLYSSPKPFDVDLFKVIYDKRTQKRLRVSDWITNHHGGAHFTDLLEERYLTIENTSEEILLCVKNYLNKDTISSNQSKEIQSIIRNSALKFAKLNQHISINTLYRFYLVAYLSKGKLDKSFYEKNF